MDIKIRKALATDLAELKQLFCDTVLNVCQSDYTSAQLKVWVRAAEKTALWRDRLSQQFFLIAEYQKRIVGFASLENGDYIDFLYVHKNFLRKGIARILFDALEKEATDQGKSILQTEASITAKPFFEQIGFIVVEKQTKVIDGVEIENFKMKRS